MSSPFALVKPPRAITLRSLKFDGSLNYSWPATLLWQDASGYIWFTPAGAPFARPAGVELVPFDWIGRVWYNRWYLVDASLQPAGVGGTAGVIHHYYCNIGTPGTWDGDEFRFTDLDLDALIYPDGRQILLDEDEFEAHTISFAYPAALVASARHALAEVLALAQAGAPPFDGALAAWHVAQHTARVSPDRAPDE